MLPILRFIYLVAAIYLLTDRLGWQLGLGIIFLALYHRVGRE